MTAFFNLFAGNKEKDDEIIRKLMGKLSASARKEVELYLEDKAELSNSAKTEISIKSLSLA